MTDDGLLQGFPVWVNVTPWECWVTHSDCLTELSGCTGNRLYHELTLPFMIPWQSNSVSDIWKIRPFITPKYINTCGVYLWERKRRNVTMGLCVLWHAHSRTDTHSCSHVHTSPKHLTSMEAEELKNCTQHIHGRKRQGAQMLPQDPAYCVSPFQHSLVSLMAKAQCSRLHAFV